MSDEVIGKWELSRRRVLATTAGLGLLGSTGQALGQPGGPWSQTPRSKVDRLNFVVWTYGDIYTRIAKQFEADWGVKVDSTISSFNDHPTKLTTMFAAGEKIDVSQSSPFSFPNFVNQGLVEPIDSLPGAADYIKDFTPFTKQVATVNGKTMGLPYFSAVWVWNYYADMLEKLKIDKPFATYDEFIEHCVKAKKDGVSRYPVLWVAGGGLEQLPGTWYQMTWNRGGTFFDKQGKVHARVSCDHAHEFGVLLNVPLLTLWDRPVRLAGLPLAAHPRSAFASTDPLAGLSRWGSGEFRRFGFLVYEATLWAGDDPQRPPLALRLDYKRSIAGSAIVDASVTEMRQLGASEADLRRWAQEMTRLFPDVRDGDQLTGIHLADSAVFLFNGSPRGEIADPEFARRFFAIWLDPRTSAPTLRAALLRRPSG